jgi:anthranilate phosphoribosyltransferase
MKNILNKLFDHQTLSYDDARNTLIQIGEGQHQAMQIASFLTVFCMRSITVAELEGFRDAMLQLCRKINLSDFNTIDIVGTGGDGKDTFNISTLASFITAGAGIKVAKHGNYGVSSSCGSSNVLEFLKVPFTNNESKLQTMLDKAGFCMMHAPLFHPAMANVAPIRKGMQVRTFFNVLGPIVNPSFPQNQLLGVFNLELARLYGYLHQNTSNNYKIVHSLDGYDEISLTAPVKIMSNQGEELFEPTDLGFPQCKQADLHGGGTIEESAKIFVNILENKGTPAQTNAVLANAGLAIQTVKPELTLADAMANAKESLLSGAGLKVLKTLQALN